MNAYNKLVKQVKSFDLIHCHSHWLSYPESGLSTQTNLKEEGHTLSLNYPFCCGFGVINAGGPESESMNLAAKDRLLEASAIYFQTWWLTIYWLTAGVKKKNGHFYEVRSVCYCKHTNHYWEYAYVHGNSKRIWHMAWHFGTKFIRMSTCMMLTIMQTQWVKKKIGPANLWLDVAWCEMAWTDLTHLVGMVSGKTHCSKCALERQLMVSHNTSWFNLTWPLVLMQPYMKDSASVLRTLRN